MDPARHRVLAGESRVRVLGPWRTDGVPRGVVELAGRVGLHPNPARPHLDQLVDAGLRPATAAVGVGRAVSAAPTRPLGNRPHDWKERTRDLRHR